jgi:hypothetical protein
VKKLYVPESEAELAVIKSLLDSERVSYFVHNDNFGSMEVGPSIPLYNSKTIMVAEDQYDSAIEVLGSFVTSKRVDKKYQPHYSLKDKIRMIFEALFLGWLMPGRMREKRKKRRWA